VELAQLQNQKVYSIALLHNIDDEYELITSSYENLYFLDADVATDYINENMTQYTDNDEYVISINQLELYNPNIIVGED